MGSIAFSPNKFAIVRNPDNPEDFFVTFKFVLSNADGVLAKKSLTAKIYRTNDTTKQATGNLTAPTTDDTGSSTFTWYPAGLFSNITLEVTSGADTGTIDGAYILISRFDLDASPSLLSEPGVIDFSATLVPNNLPDGAGVPDSVDLQWTSKDPATFPATADTGDGTKTVFRHATATSFNADEIKAFGGAGLSVTVTAAGAPQTGKLATRTMTAQIGYLQAPIYMPGVQTDRNIIDDNTVLLYSHSGIPWAIPQITTASTSASTQVTLWASSVEITSLAQFKAHATDVTRLQNGSLDGQVYTVLNVDVNNVVFQQRTATIYVFYTLTDVTTGNLDAYVISDSGQVYIDRNNVSIQVDSTLVPLQLSQYTYGVDDLLANRTMAATFTFPTQRKLHVDDVLTVIMDLTGVASDNLGQFTEKKLVPLQLSQPLIDAATPIVFPSVAAGGMDNGYTSIKFSNIEPSNGEVYYTVKDAATNNISRSASRSIYVATVPPHSGVDPVPVILHAQKSLVADLAAKTRK